MHAARGLRGGGSPAASRMRLMPKSWHVQGRGKAGSWQLAGCAGSDELERLSESWPLCGGGGGGGVREFVG
jgi:hypothetical protein